MRFMIIGKATVESEAGILPKPEAFAAMQSYNEELVKAVGLEDFGEEFTPNPEIAKVKIK